MVKNAEKNPQWQTLLHVTGYALNQRGSLKTVRLKKISQKTVLVLLDYSLALTVPGDMTCLSEQPPKASQLHTRSGFAVISTRENHT